MKKIFLGIVVACCTMASCSKDRTCTCTTTHISETDNGQAVTVDPPQTVVTKLTKVNSKSADCKSGESTTSETVTYTIPGFPTQSFLIVKNNKTDCKLN